MPYARTQPFLSFSLLFQLLLRECSLTVFKQNLRLFFPTETVEIIGHGKSFTVQRFFVSGVFGLGPLLCSLGLGGWCVCVCVCLCVCVCEDELHEEKCSLASTLTFK